MLFYALLCGFCHTSVDLFEDEENSENYFDIVNFSEHCSIGENNIKD